MDVWIAFMARSYACHQVEVVAIYIFWGGVHIILIIYSLHRGHMICHHHLGMQGPPIC